MKATGIVRRIDELGRVVIPKEIRRTLLIREGDPLEIFTEHEGNIILKKYSPIGELASYAKFFSDAVSRTFNKSCVICDTDSVVSASGSGKKEYADRRITKELRNSIEKRDKYFGDKAAPFPLIEGIEKEINSFGMIPIISEGHTIGAVLSLSKEGEAPVVKEDMKALEVIASFLGKQMEQ